MKTIQVELGLRSYQVHVKSGLIEKIPVLLSKNNHGQKWVIISQHGLLELFGFELISVLRRQHFNIDYVTLPMGEAAKSIKEFSSIISQLSELGCDRSTTVLALGGGVVGDISGFAASTFMRGIEYFHIPTTLLAMVDSSIGGKTGINIVAGKNMVGTFYQPKGVFVDPNILSSLPRTEVIAGLGEVIKYGAIKDADFLREIYTWLNDIDSFPFEEAIRRCCEIKAGIISIDEQENDLRRILNFGHTIGHALEAYLGYGKIRHGEAVALGMKCSSWISERINNFSNKDAEYLNAVINKLPLPKIPTINADHLIPFVKMDKKSKKGNLNFVVLDCLGNATICKNVSEELIRNSLEVLN
ncbi:MAG: 3-dehydroquinate synthase [Candidatus Marinimicrobia bacterium]|nr:3-dehydroquinate synthase [Candidatus Neomarinimicrobiota bacterium]|tara:strand:- start:6662 stop:7732 length:1071 start_codon:yes stop_codon:yes gene_type:complete